MAARGCGTDAASARSSSMSPLFLTLGLMLGIGVAVPAVASPHARRQLLIFAPDTPSPALTEQRRLLAGESAALRERDLDVIEVGGTAPLRRRYAVAAARSRCC